MPATPELTDRDRAVLDLELQRFQYQGRKEQAIRDQIGVNATRYYQLLNALIDTPAALVAEPMLVHRLRRIREDRQRARHSTQRLAG